MYHTIEFAVDLNVDQEISPRRPLERLYIRKGSRLRAEIKPHIVESGGGPVEVADLFLDNGTTVRQVPFASFRFVES